MAALVCDIHQEFPGNQVQYHSECMYCCLNNEMYLVVEGSRTTYSWL